MHFYIPGAIAGIIVFQVSIIAPTMFKKLKIEDFGTAIRSIWPKFFALICFLALASIGVMLISTDGNNIHLGISGFTLLASGICYGIIPATNRATDAGNSKKFDLLHKLSVWLTVAILLANIAFLLV